MHIIFPNKVESDQALDIRCKKTLVCLSCETKRITITDIMLYINNISNAFLDLGDIEK